MVRVHSRLPRKSVFAASSDAVFTCTPKLDFQEVPVESGFDHGGAGGGASALHPASSVQHVIGYSSVFTMGFALLITIC